MREQLTHYIIVRRDLAIGDLAAQVAHAAGESFYKFATLAGSLMLEHPPTDNTPLEGDGCSIQPPRASETIVVVLGARNEARLLKLEKSLTESFIGHAAIREVDGTYRGQLMAIGLLPSPKLLVERFVRDFHLLPNEKSL